ncbi:CBO0543 family protein [Bacillus sp. V5-8f]|uniref:CBO0543 family protein n=1 Tax=Bacillus sp. V5-8f TaxID=2053044 RepID=UPI000C78F209|nr:CBO0543 family protein [Bacillus sp. V5-8f]PLT34073.1 hypothetical protein CUU64_10735 [Bacillus sp. V5-8f]
MNTINENHMVEMRKIEDKLLHIDINHWLEYEVFTWQWWMLVVFLIMPWIIWFFLVKRDHIIQTFLFGMFILIITKLFDVIGLQYGLWEYPIQLLPIIPRGLPFDMSMVPVAFMLLYQYFNTWKTYLIAQILMAVLYAFIGETFSEWVQVVSYIRWNYIFSFFYYILVGVGTRFILLKLIALQETRM